MCNFKVFQLNPFTQTGKQNIFIFGTYIIYLQKKYLIVILAINEDTLVIKPSHFTVTLKFMC